MRNDAHDEFDNLPSLTPGRRDTFSEPAEPAAPYRASPAPVQVVAAGASTGPLWALIGALSIALAALGWWSLQQMNLMEQRLVATQESFARISEEASGQIQDISGKVVATESSVTTGSEALKLTVKQLETRLTEVAKQLLNSQNAQAEQSRRLEQLSTELKTASAARSELTQRLQTLSSEQSALKAAQVDSKALKTELDKVASSVSRSSSDIAELKKQGNPTQALQALEQDVLVLRSQLETRPAPAAASEGPSMTEYDAFRAQMTRNISTLQSQVVNLQQQINAR